MMNTILLLDRVEPEEPLNEQQLENKAVMDALEERSKQKRTLLLSLLHVDKWIPEHPEIKQLIEAVKEFKAATSHLVSPLLTTFNDICRIDPLDQLVHMGTKYAAQVGRLEQEIRECEKPITDCGGWREVEDDQGGRIFESEQGLMRWDCPQSWIEEEHNRMRRCHEARERIIEEENLFVMWSDFTLADIDNLRKKGTDLGKKMKQKVDTVIDDEELYDALKEAIKHCEDMVECQQKVLTFFNYRPPVPIPNIPFFGVTNAYNARRARLGGMNPAPFFHQL